MLPPFAGLRPASSAARRVGCVLFGVVLLSVLVAGCPRGGAGRPPAGDSTGRMRVHGTPRTYRVYVPHHLGPARVPLVIAFHGRLGTGRDMERLTGFSELAERRGLVVVYPDGIGRSWNNGSGVGAASRRHVDDERFVTALIDRLGGNLPVDRRRVYAVGFSAGAILTQRLGCDLGDRLAAVVAVAGPMAPGVARSCHPARPVPVLEVQGTADRFAPAAGGHTAGGGEIQPAATTVREWVRRDACRPDATTDAPATGVACDRYGGCGGAAEVRYCQVRGAGHTWPGSSHNLPGSVVGPTNEAFDMTAYAYTFFGFFGRS